MPTIQMTLGLDASIVSTAENRSHNKPYILYTYCNTLSASTVRNEKNNIRLCLRTLLGIFFFFFSFVDARIPYTYICIYLLYIIYTRVHLPSNAN